MVGEVIKKINEHESFVLTSHARPDGDAIGSVLACYQILQALGKQVNVILSDGVPLLYRRLPRADAVIQASEIKGRCEAAIILECESLQRTRLRGLEHPFLINIDHHASGRPFANLNWIDPSACATAEMIYELASKAGVKITPDMATCLYTAVLTDTGSFRFSGTNHRTFALAEELVRCGADPVKIGQAVYFSNPISKTLLLGAALRNLKRDGLLAWMHVTREDMARCQAAEEDCEGLVNYALGIAGIEAAAFFRELEKGRFRVSLRSKGAIDVAAVADELGGGGHECASGCSVDGPLPAAEKLVLGKLRYALLRVSSSQHPS
ncbi:MAG TPA: bifunctional oligoribonuclease/PAP phosphatase NrnA [Terriglobales bacterium]|jgi:phosphoesterase RecJ-like protein|nr:bifunctional oligoribonuclease/PAP phosphatase NrnA [Terriglobales bacterium]